MELLFRAVGSAGLFSVTAGGLLGSSAVATVIELARVVHSSNWGDEAAAGGGGGGALLLLLAAAAVGARANEEGASAATGVPVRGVLSPPPTPEGGPAVVRNVTPNIEEADSAAGLEVDDEVEGVDVAAAAAAAPVDPTGRRTLRKSVGVEETDDGVTPAAGAPITDGRPRAMGFVARLHFISNPKFGVVAPNTARSTFMSLRRSIRSLDPHSAV